LSLGLSLRPFIVAIRRVVGKALVDWTYATGISEYGCRRDHDHTLDTSFNGRRHDVLRAVDRDARSILPVAAVRQMKYVSRTCHELAQADRIQQVCTLKV